MKDHLVVSLGDFMEMSIPEQRSYLRHPAWEQRCRCHAYGYPWHQIQSVIGDDGFKHLKDICAPMVEFFD